MLMGDNKEPNFVETYFVHIFISQILQEIQSQ